MIYEIQSKQKPQRRFTKASLQHLIMAIQIWMGEAYGVQHGDKAVRLLKNTDSHLRTFFQ